MNFISVAIGFIFGMDSSEVKDLIQTPEMFAGFTQGIMTIIAAFIALVAVKVGVNHTHQKNYDEWRWQHIYELVIEIDSHAWAWEEVTAKLAGRVLNGETVTPKERAEKIQPKIDRITELNRRATALLPPCSARDSIDAYLRYQTLFVEDFDLLNESNKNPHAEKDEFTRNLERQTVLGWYYTTQNRHRVLLADFNGDLREELTRSGRFKLKCKKIIIRSRNKYSDYKKNHKNK